MEKSRGNPRKPALRVGHGRVPPRGGSFLGVRKLKMENEKAGTPRALPAAPSAGQDSYPARIHHMARRYQNSDEWQPC